MTKLALLIGAKPHNGKIGPVVRLERGIYIAQLENVTTSIIMLCSSSRGLIDRIIHGAQFQLESEDHWTHVTLGGPEKYINISLERIR